jgi:hypothetical protein
MAQQIKDEKNNRFTFRKWNPKKLDAPDGYETGADED